MKKFLGMMMCAGLLFTVTGCGDEKKEEETSKTDTTKVEETVKNKVLSCSVSMEDIDFMKTDMEFVYDAEGKKMSDASAKMTLTYDEDELAELSDEEIQEFCGQAGDEDAIKSCKAKVDGNKLVVDLKYDINKLSEELDTSISEETSIDELKEFLEDRNEGAVCKIED